MEPGQMMIQFGIAGAMLFVFYRLSLRSQANSAKATEQTIALTRETERDRTMVIANGFAAITTKLDAHATADQESHRAMAIEIAGFKGLVSGVMDAGERLTPITGVPIAQPHQHPVPHIPRRETPGHGVPVPVGSYHEQPKRKGTRSDGG